MGCVCVCVYILISYFALKWDTAWRKIDRQTLWERISEIVELFWDSILQLSGENLFTFALLSPVQHQQSPKYTQEPLSILNILFLKGNPAALFLLLLFYCLRAPSSKKKVATEKPFIFRANIEVNLRMLPGVYVRLWADFCNHASCGHNILQAWDQNEGWGSPRSFSHPVFYQ